MSKLLLDESPLQVQRSLACFIGLNEAMILQQLHYMTGNDKLGQVVDGVRWIRMTQEDWCQEFPFFDVGQIKRALKNLQDDELLLGRTFDGKGRSKWYSLDYDKIGALTEPVGRVSGRQTKRKEAIEKRYENDDYEKVMVQNVPIDDSDSTKCTEALVQNVLTIGTKCTTSKISSKTSTKTPSPNGEGGKPPRASKSKKSESLSTAPEAVMVYRSVTNRYPDKSTWSEIAGTVGGEPADLEFWREVVKAYIRCGWNKLNIDGMLKFYRDRRLPTTEKVTAQNGAKNNGHQPKQPSGYRPKSWAETQREKREAAGGRQNPGILPAH